MCLCMSIYKGVGEPFMYLGWELVGMNKSNKQKYYYWTDLNVSLHVIILKNMVNSIFVKETLIVMNDTSSAWY
jgi:hypothetical protein